MDLSFLPTVPPGVRRALRVRRRELMGVLLVLAAALAALAIVPPEPSPTTAVVASRDVSAGETLARGDLQITEVPPSLAPSAVLTDPDTAVGQITAATLPAGRPVAASDLASSPTVLASAPPDSTVLAVPITDDRIARALTPGRELLLFLSSADASGLPGGPGPSATTSVVAVVLVPPDPTAGDQADPSALIAVPASEAAATGAAIRLGWFTVGIPSL